MPLFETKG